MTTPNKHEAPLWDADALKKRLPPTHLPEGTRPRDVPDMVPPDFVTGLEFVNDDKTPMEFVDTTLHQHLGMEREAAIALMLSIHQRGGVLVPLEPLERAQAIAALIEAEAQAAGHPLTCRALDMETKVVPGNSQVTM